MVLNEKPGENENKLSEAEIRGRKVAEDLKLVREEADENPENHTDQDRYRNEILQLIRKRESPDELRDELDDYHEQDIAAVLPELSDEEWQYLATCLDVSRIADVMEHTDEDESENYLERLPIKKTAQILASMEPDKAVDFLKNTDFDRKEQWLNAINVDKRSSLRKLAQYPEDTIGSRMTTNFIAMRLTTTVKDARDQLVTEASVHDNISTIYVTDERGTYAGAFALRDLILAKEEETLTDITVPAYPSVYADERISDCLQVIKEYSEESIPVLTHTHRILGVVTANDVVEVLDDEMSDDYAKLGGLSAEADLREPISTSIRKRLPWLVLLLFLGMGVSSIIGLYESVVAHLTLLMAFQSMILDMSGNVGTQSLAVTIRVLMDEHLKAKDKLNLVRREVSTGFLNGLILGLISLVSVGLYILIAKHTPVIMAFGVSLCIGFSMIVALSISALVGTVIPMFFKRIGIDPAVASGPLITTVTDLVGVVSYYTLASVMLIGILGM